MVHIIIYSIIVVAFALGGYAYYKLKAKLNKAHNAYIEVYNRYIELKNKQPKHGADGRFIRKQDNE